MERNFVIAASFVFWVGCRGFELNDSFQVGEEFYHDIPFEINGKEYAGFAAIPYARQIKLYAKVKHKFDYMSIRTLNREIFREDATKKLEETLILNPEIENGLVVVDVGLFNVAKTQHYWGKILVVESDPETNLEGLMICNGSKGVSKGTSACQARENLLQYISFLEPVRFAETEDCAGTIAEIDPQQFEVKMRRGLCVYRFANAAGNQHRLVTLGYNKIFFRETLE